MREEFKHGILPGNHLLTHHVHRVVKRILHASNLGSIRGEERAVVPSSMGLGTDAEGRVWNPDADVGAARDPGASYGPEKEWDVIVVNNMKVVNAMANPGIVFLAPPFEEVGSTAHIINHQGSSLSLPESCLSAKTRRV